MTECTRKTCKLTGQDIPPLEQANDRCGNCDHHAVLHTANGCSVQIQMGNGNKNEKCPCTWDCNQASDEDELVPESHAPFGDYYVSRAKANRSAELRAALRLLR